MSDTTGPEGEVEVLRERKFARTSAILRISTGLDADTVLREIAEAVRTLTGARYAVITAVDAAGQIEDAVLCGFTPEEEHRVVERTDSMRVLGALRDLSSPVRGAGVRAHVSGLGSFAPTG